MKPFLNIIIPGIRVNHWQTMVEQMKFSCKKYPYEITFIGPYDLPESLKNEPNVKYIKSFGSPARCYCEAIDNIGKSEWKINEFVGLDSELKHFITSVSDDSYLCEDGLDYALDLLLNKDSDKDIISCRYTEGCNYAAGIGSFDLSYWFCGTHTDLQQPGIDPKLMFAVVPMLSLDRFNYLGFDCRFEHVNFNMIDLSLRNYKDGGQVYLSPLEIQRVDFLPGRNEHNNSVIAAYVYNDKGLFYDMYSKPDLRPQCIGHNWKEQEVVWSRRKF